MHGSTVTVYIVLAFLVGAVFPLLGLLFAAACIGAWWATRVPRTPRLLDRELQEEVEEIIRREKERR